MRATRVLFAMLLLCACGGRRQPQADDVSGFLDDYRMLRPGGAGDVALVYRDPDADWPSYGKVLFEPVTLWRSGRKSLDPVPEADLLRLIADLEGAVRRRLGEGFELVEHAEPGTMRIRLAITEARASDPVLDVLRGRGGGGDTAAGDGPLHAETQRFIEHAHIEGEIRDASTDRLLAAGLDRRPEGAAPITTWADVDRALDRWAERVCARLEARTRRR